MNTFWKNIAKDILTESINAGKAGDAIRNRHEVKITYEGDDGGERIIQPVAYGLSKAGNMVLRAFQPYGTTKTKVPHWKMFRLDKINTWKQLRDRIFTEPPGQFSAEGKFNPNGDEAMSEVYLVANFERSKDYHSGKSRYAGLKKYNTDRQKKKEENDPFYKFKKNVSSAPILKDVKDRVEKYRSQGASDYVSGNDRYQNDMYRVDTENDEKNVLFNEPVTKDYEPRVPLKQQTLNADIEEPTYEIEVDDENNEELNQINNGQ